MADEGESRTVQTPQRGPIEIQHADGRIEHPSVARETTDIRYALVAVSIVLLGLALVGVTCGARWLIHLESRNDSRRLPAADDLPMKLSIQPRLEPFEPQLPTANSFAADIQAMEGRLQSYGPTDEADFVHVPIEIAIQHVARQLQKPAAEREPKSRGLINAGDSNSGRVFRGESP